MVDNDGSRLTLRGSRPRDPVTTAWLASAEAFQPYSRCMHQIAPHHSVERSLLGAFLPEGMMFPFDFGFVPSTLGDDGDPLDILVLMDAPAHVGCLIDVRIIGVIEAVQIQDGKKERNGRLFGAAVHSYEHDHLESIDDIRKSRLSQIEEFFVSYNKQRGKKFKITDTAGPKKAIKFLQAGIQAHKHAKKK